jgi:hypothetical protein
MTRVAARHDLIIGLRGTADCCEITILWSFLFPLKLRSIADDNHSNGIALAVGLRLGLLAYLRALGE